MSKSSSESSKPAFTPVSRTRAYQQVLVQIEEQILSGALGVGDRLPAERDLASMFAVSRAAVREAIRALEAQGVLRSAVGVGPEGGTTISALPAEALATMLRLHVALSNFPMDDVIDTRVMLERQSAQLAAVNAEQEELETIRSHHEAMKATEDREVFNEHDTAFHVAIAGAAHNRLVTDMTTAIRDSMRRPILEAFRESGSWDEHSRELVAGHAEILDALLDRNPAEAADAVERHIRKAYSVLHWTD